MVPLEGVPLALNNLTARFSVTGELIIEDATGQVLDTQACVAQLTQHGTLKNVLALVWVPSELVVLTEVFVPGKRKSDWMAALPYALEESLSEPVENLHFVALHRNKEGMVSVAIVTHQWMAQWVNTLQALGLNHVQLIPECFRVPVADNASSIEAEGGEVAPLIWNVIADKEVLQIRSGPYSGFSVYASCLDPFIQAAQQGGGEISLNYLTENHRLNSQLDTNQSISSLTLRTDDYQAQSKSLKYWQDWRWPAVLIGLVLIVSLVATWQKTQILAEQTLQYQTQTERLFKEMFPDVKRIVNIKMQTQTRLNNQQGGGGNNSTSFVALLQAIEPLFKGESSVTIHRIQWQNERLMIAVTAEHTQQLQTLVNMSQQNSDTSRAVKVELELTNVTPDLVEGVFHVTAK